VKREHEISKNTVFCVITAEVGRSGCNHPEYM